jgi:hypothetical protein
MCYFEDGFDIILVPYALILLRDALDLRSIYCAKRLFLLFLTTTPLGPDKRIKGAL